MTFIIDGQILCLVFKRLSCILSHRKEKHFYKSVQTQSEKKGIMRRKCPNSSDIKRTQQLRQFSQLHRGKKKTTLKVAWQNSQFLWDNNSSGVSIFHSSLEGSDITV